MQTEAVPEPASTQKRNKRGDMIFCRHLFRRKEKNCLHVDLVPSMESRAQIASFSTLDSCVPSGVLHQAVSVKEIE